MVSVTVVNPKGTIPGTDSELLPTNYASLAENVKLRGGKLTPFNTTLPVAPLSKIGVKQTVTRWDSDPDGDLIGKITGATKTNPVSISSANHGLITGAKVYISEVLGMTELNSNQFTVTVTGLGAYTLDGINGTAYGAYTSGGTWVNENGKFLHWLDDVDAVKGSINGDIIERTYFTGDGVPKMTYSPIVETGGTDYPNNSYELGIPAPDNAPVAVAVIESLKNIFFIDNTFPAVVTIANHNLESGLLIEIDNVVGMTEINGKQYYITVMNINEFSLQDINGNDVDSTGYGAYISDGDGVVSYLEGDLESRSYIITYLSSLDEEGVPSPISTSIQVGPGQQVDLSSIDVGPSGNFNITKKYIYRSSTGTYGTEFLFLAEIAVAISVYEDTTAGENLLEAVPSYDWIGPQSDMIGLISLPNSLLAGFTENSLCLSEPNYPHAWPSNYRLTTGVNIVAIGNFDNVIVVATRGNPYICYAADPATAVLREIKGGQACVSKRSMASMGGEGVAYAGPTGLVVVGANGTRISTKGYLTPEQWKDLNPASMLGVFYQGNYICFYDNGTTQAGFIFDPSQDGEGYVPITIHATAIWVDPEQESLHLVIGDEVVRWDSGSDLLSYIYETKSFRISSPINPGAGRVISDTYDDTVLKLYADDTLKHSQSIADNQPFMLPDGYLADIIRVRIESTDKIKRITIAETMDDIAGAPNG